MQSINRISKFKSGSAFVASLLLCSITLLALPSKAETDLERTWTRLQNDGTEDIDTGRYGDAERTLRLAVIKGGTFGEKDLRFAKSLDELGRLYTIRGRFQEAEPLLEEALFVKEQAMNAQTGEMIPPMGAMISFYLQHGTASKADPLAEKLLAFVEGKMDEAASGSTSVKYEKGKPLTGWAGKAAPTMVTPVIEWAITCDDIGNQYRLRGNLDLAERLFKAALDVKETVLGKHHLSLANSYDSLGTIYMARDNDREAEQFFTYALETTERIQPPYHPQVFSRVDKLAKCLMKEKKYDEAEKLYLRAQDFWKEHPSRNGTEARAAYALGGCYVEEKKYDAAAPVLKHALDMAEEYYGPSSISLVPYLHRYSDALYYLGRRDELGEMKSRANTIAGLSSAQQ